MAEAAEYGLMLWDGKSKGTVNNVVNLSRDHKPVVVCVAPTSQFRTIKILSRSQRSPGARRFGLRGANRRRVALERRAARRRRVTVPAARTSPH